VAGDGIPQNYSRTFDPMEFVVPDPPFDDYVTVCRVTKYLSGSIFAMLDAILPPLFEDSDAGGSVATYLDGIRLDRRRVRCALHGSL
jgi:hypothetical protein